MLAYAGRKEQAWEQQAEGGGAREEVRVHEFKLGAETTQLLEELKSKHALGTPRSFEVKRRLMPVKRPANAGKESANRRTSMRSVFHAPSRCAYL